ncbi:unnamed protein product [Musa acuminata subsp. malaccensis]|uniref:(wild Malaysian banana) hypothetical protein n=2 Tax=Musa acuminata TaxID=4641 RepID=A0A804IQ25_MUSAM|nr:PREDICTED: uncharacterized protein LOC103981739 [Musa acuminata subsp. malaccensis]CAG1842264.1 unnamed protein product [Musa acuminata subsp. malaccensis]
MQYSKLSGGEQEPRLIHSKLTQQKDEALLRVSSDVSIMNTNKIVEELKEQANGSDVQSVECECCGISEDCTPRYIKRIKEFFHGIWICGLCSEAVKEQMKRTPAVTKEQALETHMSLCKKFNRTTRLNPKLSLAVSMRDIARKSSERRTIKDVPGSKIVRAMSCGPRLDVNIKQSQVQ